MRLVESPQPAKDEESQTPSVEPKFGEKAKDDWAEAEQPAASGGRVVHLPRAIRGWDLWELSRLVEESHDQDKGRQEERRQILYYLREHTGVDGRVPAEFEPLIGELFADLIDDDAGA